MIASFVARSVFRQTFPVGSTKVVAGKLNEGVQREVIKSSELKNTPNQQTDGIEGVECSVEDLIFEAVKGYRKAQGLEVNHSPKDS